MHSNAKSYKIFTRPDCPVHKDSKLIINDIAKFHQGKNNIDNNNNLPPSTQEYGRTYIEKVSECGKHLHRLSVLFVADYLLLYFRNRETVVMLSF